MKILLCDASCVVDTQNFALSVSHTTNPIVCVVVKKPTTTKQLSDDDDDDDDDFETNERRPFDDDECDERQMNGCVR